MDRVYQQLLKRKWAVAAVFSLLLGLYVLGIQMPKRMAEVRSTYQNWRHAQSQIASATLWDTEMARLKSEQDMLHSRAEALAVRIGREEISAVVAGLSERAAAASVSMAELRPLERESGEGYDRVALQMKLGGRFHAVGRFVHLAEASEYIMKVRRLTLTASGMVEDSLQADLLLEVILLKPEGEAPGETRQPSR
jgi:Tfp pilus assembly protein PilO